MPVLVLFSPQNHIKVKLYLLRCLDAFTHVRNISEALPVRDLGWLRPLGEIAKHNEIPGVSFSRFPSRRCTLLDSLRDSDLMPSPAPQSGFDFTFVASRFIYLIFFRPPFPSCFYSCRSSRAVPIGGVPIGHLNAQKGEYRVITSEISARDWFRFSRKALQERKSTCDPSGSKERN